MLGTDKPPSAWATSFTTVPPDTIERITPANLGLSLRPAEPTNVNTWAVNQFEHAGREYWTGWVCHKCGCANERRHWYGWSCEGCKVSNLATESPSRVFWLTR